MTDTLFISHANEDTAAVQPIVAYLEANGVPCWISSRDIAPRSIYAEAITQSMRDAGACAVIVSQSANESDAIKRELELASHYKKRFIPIKVDATEPGPGLDYYLRNTQWIDYGRERERALDRIITHMKGGAAAAPRPVRPAAPPPPISYSHVASDPAPRAGAPVGLIVGGVVAVLAILGLFMWSQSNNQIATTSDTAYETTTAEAPATDTGAQDALRRQQEEASDLARQRDNALAAAQAAQQQRDANAAAMARQRDDALAAANAAQQQLANERAQRQQQANTPSIVGVWQGYSSWDTQLFEHTFTAQGRVLDVGRDAGGWTQNGNNIVYTLRALDSGILITFRGHIEGNHLIATATTAEGGNGTIDFTRQ